jgi:Ca2+-binding RTX toxin-like protein
MERAGQRQREPSVDFGDDGSAERQFNRNTFTRVVVRAGDGNDKVRVDEINGRFVEELVTLDGGQGDDTLDAGAGVDVLVGGTGNDTVDGAQSNDTVDLGSGQDTFTWSPGDANDTIEGQAGNDTVEFTGSDVAEVLRLSADGARSTLVRNIADVTLDMNAVERVDLATLGGIDTVTIGNMSGTTVRRAVVDLSNSIGARDGQPDTVTVSGIVDGSQAAIAAVEGRIELQGLRTSVGVAGSDTIDLLDVTARGGPQADVADIMDVELTLTQSGFSHGDGS